MALVFALMLGLACGVLLMSASAEYAAAAPPIKQCGDGIDNDGDGKIDFPADPGCDNRNDNSEADPLPACSDGIDNDGDGKIDFPADPGCTSATDTNESNPAPQQCADGIDNDLDGKIDYPFDPGCVSALDNDETDPPAQQCADGIDNDRDGKTDFPADPGCVSALDNDETDVAATAGSSTAPKILSPFPVVRLAGRILAKGVRVTRLTIAAPKGSSISIACKGTKRSCPRAMTKRKSTRTRVPVRVRLYERTMRSGTVLRIYVTKAGFVGKYTRFVIRSRRAPRRSDSCASKVGARVACR